MSAESRIVARTEDPTRGVPCGSGGTRLALAALFCGVASSVLLKGVGGLAPGHAIALRSGLAIALLAVVIGVRAARGRVGRLDRAGAARAALDALAGLTFALAIFELPLALLSAIQAAMPLVSVALAALVLREPLPRRALLAIAMGFAGVIVILNPGLGASPLGLALALISTLAYACRDLVTRRLRPEADMLKSVILSSLLIGAAGLATAGLPAAPRMPHVPDLARLLAAAVTFLGANTLIIAAFRRAPVARIAPLRYTSILWALLFDAAIWGHYPDAATWAGIALIVTGGLILLRPASP
ncbi:DMT family transporter [Mesobaculum littorinae]|uniref:DMT family transporter n=1 Tax=Mesobaculum littorinae TaxID=2486419 RepID=A0A438ALE6_9RHOB|nr:DMT family transporter [Mesobaculum littorinae]RVV99464.1 DMT family transporter [Mesobaculum littorinae]